MPEPVAPETPDIPPGFTLLQRGGGLWFGNLGPCYTAPGPEGSTLVGLRLEERHMNLNGVAHGGMLTTLADSALGMNIALARAAQGRPGGQVTVSLTADFLASAGVGDWVQAQVHITRLGQRLAYASCDLHSGARQVLRASAVFAFVERAGPTPARPPAP
jgi:uncharacterized protein (TIGR00369 family)